MLIALSSAPCFELFSAAPMRTNGITKYKYIWEIRIYFAYCYLAGSFKMHYWTNFRSNPIIGSQINSQSSRCRAVVDKIFLSLSRKRESERKACVTRKEDLLRDSAWMPYCFSMHQLIKRVQKELRFFLRQNSIYRENHDSYHRQRLNNINSFFHSTVSPEHDNNTADITAGVAFRKITYKLENMAHRVQIVIDGHVFCTVT